MTDITAEQLAEILRPVADEATDIRIDLGPVRIVGTVGGEWVAAGRGAWEAADLAAMHLVRRLKAEGWVPQFWPNTVRFWNGGDYPEETYEHHPVEALAKFAAASRKGTA